MQKQTYIISDVESFEPKHIFDCGQCFRWDKELDGSYTGVFKGNVMNVKKDGNNVTFKGMYIPDFSPTDYISFNNLSEPILKLIYKTELENIKLRKLKNIYLAKFF